MSDILVPGLAACENDSDENSQKDGGQRKLTESARSRKAGGLCLRSSVDERLSIFELGLSEVFMLTKCVGNFSCRNERTKTK